VSVDVELVPMLTHHGSVQPSARVERPRLT
jgi:hypothetical protein